MEESDYILFVSLFKEAYQKCFVHEINRPLTEAESKLFSNHILDQTGLTVGWRSLKNYSFYVADLRHEKRENPSIATLDTLARYVLSAPYTNEISRKNDESHHPYWFLYRESQFKQSRSAIQFSPERRNSQYFSYALILTVLLILLLIGYFWKSSVKSTGFMENFSSTDDQILKRHGWRLIDKEHSHWAKRQQHSGSLTMFTLAGDNWPDTTAANPTIKNLLIRELPFDCFAVELQMTDFVPKAEWQQAGLLLLKDSILDGPSMRVSLAYNDFFGGYHKSKEIIIQAIYSSGTGVKPEEFAHSPVLMIDSAIKMPAIFQNLNHVTLRIEKRGTHYRLLFSGGQHSNTAFKEIAMKDIGFEPRFVGIFALKGNATPAAVIPVNITGFGLRKLSCDERE